jgi:GT2 family glycosyltransferase
VDNASRERFDGHHRRTVPTGGEIAAPAVNLGFAGGINAGIRAAQALP